MINIKKMIKAVNEQNYVDFKKTYIPEMKKDYSTKEKIVRDYVLKQISNGKSTYIG